MALDFPVNAADIAINLLLCLCVIAMPFAPIASTVGAVILDSIVTMHMVHPLNVGTMAILQGVGFVSFGYGVIASCVVLLLAAVEQFALSAVLANSALPWAASISIVLTYCVSAAIGYLARCQVRSQRKNERENDIRHHMAMWKHDVTTAMRLHDHAAGDMSIIARMAQGHLRRSPVDVEEWTQVNELALRALEDLHCIIDDLRSHENIDEESGVLDTLNRHDVTLYVEEHDLKMNQVGIHGHTTIRFDGSFDMVPERKANLVLRLVGEIYTNIAKYAGTDYSMTVAWDTEKVAIIESNDVVEIDEVRADDMRRKGAGLSHYRRLLERSGGSLEYGVKDGRWKLTAVIR
ncbi:sensor histidine kinase [Bifidobacterium leontopitheci]|uniref:hypothetical protein n=1 Tax=Bifidobacterium leontopitheci TaxID=2650774 RepID=UPI001264F9A6|nr:hypothetical protein [Bifidobacterium leontopitheci]